MIRWMSPSDQLSPTSGPGRTRLLMTGAFVGALLVLALSVMFSWPATVNSPIATSDPEAERARMAFDSPTGSCLTWTKLDSSDMRKIACEKPHLFEVIGVLSIAKQYPEGRPPPDRQTWRQITQQKCSERAKTYLGKPLDPHGKYTVNSLRPSDEQWEEGDRKLRCGLQRVTPGGALQPLSGPAAKHDQSDTYEPGTCLGLVRGTVGDPVDCSKAHAYEIVGTIDLGKEFTDGYPAEKDQQTYLDKTCSEEVDKYSGGKDIQKNGLVLTWDTRQKASWEAGSKKVNCKIAAEPKNKTSLSPVTGTIRKSPPSAPDTPKPPPKPNK